MQKTQKRIEEINSILREIEKSQKRICALMEEKKALLRKYN